MQITTQTLRVIAGTIIFIPFLIILGYYIWLSFREILVTLRNYNLPRAKYCNPKFCGFFHHIGDSSKSCMNPIVREKKFIKLSQNLNQPGCKLSVELREQSGERRLASEYRKEYLELYNAFHISKLWWRIVTILVSIFLLIAGTIATDKLIDMLF
jgi:hypothetical protein